MRKPPASQGPRWLGSSYLGARPRRPTLTASGDPGGEAAFGVERVKSRGLVRRSGCRRSAVAAGADDVQVQGVHRGDMGFPFPRDLLEALGQRKVADRLALRRGEM